MLSLFHEPREYYDAHRSSRAYGLINNTQPLNNCYPEKCMNTPYIPPAMNVFYDPPPLLEKDPTPVAMPERPYTFFESFYSEPPMTNAEGYTSPYQVYEANEFSHTWTQHNKELAVPEQEVSIGADGPCDMEETSAGHCSGSSGGCEAASNQKSCEESNQCVGSQKGGCERSGASYQRQENFPAKACGTNVGPCPFGGAAQSKNAKERNNNATRSAQDQEVCGMEVDKKKVDIRNMPDLSDRKKVLDSKNEVSPGPAW